MAKSPVFDHDNASDHLKTWILKVYIHCEGCKKKVIKILQSIDGVYKMVIDAKEHKVTVTGSVDGDTLVQKLLKSGKHAEILPGSFEATKKKKQSSKQKDGGDETEHVDKENEKPEDAKTDDGNAEEVEAEPPVGANGDVNNENTGGKKKKKKKNKGDKDGNIALESAVAIEKAGPEELNLGPPLNYATPYDMIPPYSNNYYPAPAYGMSYNTSYTSTESSYYTPPVYGYAQSHPHPLVYYPPSYHRRSVFDDHDVENEGRLCTIM